MLYPNLFAYLNDHSGEEDRVIEGRDRAIITTHSTTLEIPFPYLKPTDVFPPDNQLQTTISLTDDNISLTVTDEVLDIATLEDEREIPHWEERLGERLDDQNALLIAVFNQIFNQITTEFHSPKEDGNYLLIQLPIALANFNPENAKLPLVVSLERRYQLTHNLRLISTKLRHQLRRKPEMMSVGKIQEMDEYCLRDYVRKPGKTAAEKAGSKQQLMGIKREENYNTPENKFLVYCCRLLHLNCRQYRETGNTQYQEEVGKIQRSIDGFYQLPQVKTIQTQQYHFTKPNYVLQQNPIYRRFYQGYLDYIEKRYLTQKIWSYRQRLFSDWVGVSLLATLTHFSGSYVSPLGSLPVSKTPEYGEYLSKSNPDPIIIFLRDRVYQFQLRKPTTGETHCDWILTVTVNWLDSETIEDQHLKIWNFWYLPSEETRQEAEIYFQTETGIVFFLESPPDDNLDIYPSWLQQLPHPLTEDGLTHIRKTLARIIEQWINMTFGKNSSQPLIKSGKERD